MRNGYPLVELHRHLDGNIRLETVLDLGRRHNLDLPAWELEALRPHVQITTPEPGLVEFLAKFDVLQRVMVDYDAVRRITRENLEDAVREGIDHIELRFSPAFMSMRHGLDVLKTAEAVCRALAEFHSEGPQRAKLIMILSRNLDPALVDLELEAAIRFRDDGVVALDLAGNERDYPGSLFVRHFRQARDKGLRVIAHAGEAAGPESIRQAVTELGAERIGHGIAARRDERLMDLLAERRIALEVCPTSNVHTSTVSGYADHPLPMFLRRGMRVTLNTDDPSISGIDLAYEYDIARTRLGLSEPELRLLQEHAVAAAFLTDIERGELLRRCGVE
jgi:adenosine deaminase